MEAPVRSETTITTEDNAREGVPVGGRPPPNFLPEFILARSYIYPLLLFTFSASHDFLQGYGAWEEVN
jgi:hypothetical protein